MEAQLQMFSEGIEMIKGAELSECGRYRFKLWRIWDQEKPKVLFIMHNPSTADANEDDPTIRRCIGFAKSWGYGGFYVGNISPYRATDPVIFKKSEEARAEVPANWSHYFEMIYLCQLHVVAYGVPQVPVPKYMEQKGNPMWHCLKLTKDGHPCHPLYLPSSLKPIPFNP
jgi:hypothetical protein